MEAWGIVLALAAQRPERAAQGLDPGGLLDLEVRDGGGLVETGALVPALGARTSSVRWSPQGCASGTSSSVERQTTQAYSGCRSRVWQRRRRMRAARFIARST